MASELQGKTIAILSFATMGQHGNGADAEFFFAGLSGGRAGVPGRRRLRGCRNRACGLSAGW